MFKGNSSVQSTKVKRKDGMLSSSLHEPNRTPASDELKQTDMQMNQSNVSALRPFNLPEAKPSNTTENRQTLINSENKSSVIVDQKFLGKQQAQKHKGRRQPAQQQKQEALVPHHSEISLIQATGSDTEDPFRRRANPNF